MGSASGMRHTEKSIPSRTNPSHDSQVLLPTVQVGAIMPKWGCAAGCAPKPSRITSSRMPKAMGSSCCVLSRNALRQGCEAGCALRRSPSPAAACPSPWAVAAQCCPDSVPADACSRCTPLVAPCPLGAALPAGRVLIFKPWFPLPFPGTWLRRICQIGCAHHI